MSLVIGVLLLALCALAFLLALSVFRQTVRPGWTRREDSGTFVSLGILMLGASGLGFLIQFGVEFRSQSFSLIHAALAVAIVAGGVVLGRRLLAVHRLRRDAPLPEPRDGANDRGPVPASAAPHAAPSAAARPEHRPRKAA